MRQGSTDSALHAKVIVYDHRYVWIGSANYDQRSRRLNTEVGFLIDSKQLAERVLKGLESDFSPRQSWRLVLENIPDSDAPRIVWTGEQNGKPTREYDEPGVGLLRHMGVFLYSLVPGLEDHL
jgi:cardiolipin synthase C